MWTDRQVKSFEPKEKRYRVSDDLGQRGAGKFVIDIQPNGTKTFFTNIIVKSLQAQNE